MKYRTKPVDPVVVDAVKYDGNLTLPAVEKDLMKINTPRNGWRLHF